MTDFALRQTDFAPTTIGAALAPIRVNPASRKLTQAPVAFAIVRDFAAFEALESQWNDLFAIAARSEQIFQSFSWNWHWARHYLAAAKTSAPGPRLAIVTGRIDGRLALIMPLVAERTAGLTQLSWMGEPVSQYGDVIASPDATALETLLGAWRFAVKETRADFANLRKVRSDAIAAPLLAALGARITATDEAPFLDLKPFIDAPAFDAHLATKGRNKNRRRQSRRLHDLGPVEFETHAGTEEAARLAVDAIALKRNWLEAKQQVSLALTDAKFSAFFADVAGGRSKPAPVEVRALRSNGRIAALQVLLVSGEARFLHIVVYADEFEKCGVGSLLLENTVKESYRAGNATFDLLPPKYEYKSEFSDASMLVHDHALALSLVGRAYIAGYLGFRRRIKQTIEAAPGPVRHAIGRGLSAIQRLRA